MSAGIARLPCGDIGHVVHFYGDDDELVESVSSYLLAALENDGVAIVVATPEHALAFQMRLAIMGIDMADARESGALLVLDADQTVRDFLVDDRPEPEAFEAVIGGLVGTATATGRPVRIYGEMVALLWQAGQVTAAVELEELWNDLGRRLSFSLFCAYPSRAVTGNDDVEAFRAVCHQHSVVIGSERGDDDAVRTFGIALDAPRAARRFVIDTLRQSGTESVIDDAALLVSELATNAVLHARSEFTVAVSRSASVVRIAVRDGSPVPPNGRPASVLASSGRGLGIVAALASRWDYEPLGFGKVVWAELNLR